MLTNINFEKVKNVLSLILLGFSVSSFAEKIVITGEPVILEQNGDVYTLPSSYTVTSSTPYHYVTIEGNNKVCYLNQPPQLASLKMTPIKVSMGGQVVQWNCYDYNETVFELAP